MNLKKNKCWISKISLLFWPNNYCAVSQQSKTGFSLLNMILSIPTDPVIFIFKISAFCTHCPFKEVEFRAVIWNALYSVSPSTFHGNTRAEVQFPTPHSWRCTGGGLLEKDAHNGVWKEPLIQNWCRVSHTFLWRMETGLFGRPGPQPVWLLTEVDYKIADGNRGRSVFTS